MIKIYGFKFNNFGDLLEYPENPSFSDLQKVYTALINDQQYIKASRINHLAMVYHREITTPLFCKL